MVDSAALFTARFPLCDPIGDDPRLWKKPAVTEWQRTPAGRPRPPRNYSVNMLPGELVIDVDAYKDEGASLKQLMLDCPELHHTKIIKTPKGGYHFYVIVPTGVKIKQQIGRAHV